MYRVSRRVVERFSRQHGLASRSQLRNLGVSRGEEAKRVARGEWERVHKRVLRVAGSPFTPEQTLMAAVLEVGPIAVASHGSAVWLWGLSDSPQRHSITAPRGTKVRIRAVDLHQVDQVVSPVSVRAGIPVTNPLRALVDFAGEASDAAIDLAVDKALARGIVTVEGLEAEIGRRARKGRKGPAALRRSLERRGMTGAPHPSVLESKTLRLLKQAGIVPLGCEVKVGDGGRYRVDVVLAPGLILEVDGYTYHRAPEAKGYDDERRNRLQLQGWRVLVYSWSDITRDGLRVLAELHEALASAATSA